MATRAHGDAQPACARELHRLYHIGINVAVTMTSGNRCGMRFCQTMRRRVAS
jgi:hypothetical protein